ncbi:MAG: tetratricopeptide repeat protein, partial [Deltaproteobacteria bacterium]|nr:tetratricopeptide repeat protein [Deltaproteobacteria bacterium]MBW2534835.1 tetratricopeptide repeat protein [Deltaproteobacteria bacterium]
MAGAEGRRRGRAGWLVALAAVAGCGASERSWAAPEEPVVSVRAPDRFVEERERRGAGSCREITLREPALSKAGAASAKQRMVLDERIRAADAAMREGAFEDAEVMVELARLELARCDPVSPEPSHRPTTPGLQNARRAVVVAPQMPEARLVLALAIARSVLAGEPARDASSRAAALRLVEMAGQAALVEAAGATRAVTHGLLGFVELDRGDLSGAEQQIERALAVDPGCPGAWLARGELLRARQDLVPAERAYQRALQLAPGHGGALAGLRAAGRCEGLRLPPQGSIPGAASGLSPLGLAPPAPQVSSCSATLMAEPRAEKLCRGRADLLRAATPDAYRAAANLIIAGWIGFKSACEAEEPVCTAEVPAALAEASRAYRAAGLPGKAVASARVLLSDEAPSVTPPELRAQLLLETADAYYRLAMYDRALVHYEQYAAGGSASPTGRAARQRAAALREAL